MSNAVDWSLLKQQYVTYRGSNPLFDLGEEKVSGPTVPMRWDIDGHWHAFQDCENEEVEYQAAKEAISKRNVVPQTDNKTVSIVVPSSMSIARSKVLGFLNAFVWPMMYLKERQLKLGSGSENEAARAAVEERMRRILDEFTHLANFPQPVDQELIIAVTAKHDAYLPRDGNGSLSKIWPQAEIRHVDRGHIAAFLLDQKIFR